MTPYQSYRDQNRGPPNDNLVDVCARNHVTTCPNPQGCPLYTAGCPVLARHHIETAQPTQRREPSK